MSNTANQGTSVPTENKESKEKIPKSLQDSSIVKTKVTNLSKIIEDKLLALKDLATLELFMPVHARLRERYKSIKEMSSARHLKIRGHWKTTNPRMHITKLQSKILSNDEAELTFSVFEMDKEGNKKLYENTTKVQLYNGDVVERTTSAEYRIAYDVREIIRTGKPIEREVIKIDRVN